MEQLGITNNFLNRTLQKTAKMYIGMNKLGRSLHNKNFSAAYNRAHHFVCIIAESNKIIYFDPLGLPPHDASIIEFLNADPRPLHINGVTIQHPFSFYCAFFVLLRILSHENPFVTVEKFNYENLEYNDAICIRNILRLIN